MAGNGRGNLVKEESHKGWKLQNLNIFCPQIFDIVITDLTISLGRDFKEFKSWRLKELKIQQFSVLGRECGGAVLIK